MDLETEILSAQGSQFVIHTHELEILSFQVDNHGSQFVIHIHEI